MTKDQLRAELAMAGIIPKNIETTIYIDLERFKIKEINFEGRLTISSKDIADILKELTEKHNALVKYLSNNI